MNTAAKSSEFKSVQDVLKRAILLEMNGKEFFAMAAKTATSPVAKELFEHFGITPRAVADRVIEKLNNR